jgi:hypothetical protein
MYVSGDHKHSSGDPILRRFDDGKRRVYACGGLHYLRGNRAPHFSLTIHSWTFKDGRKHEDIFGCGHEELLQRWPELAPLAALHLSEYPSGAPMHAVENGFYQLAGYAGGLGEHYHAGNAPSHGGTPPTPETCLASLARHVRLPVEVLRPQMDSLLDGARRSAAEYGYRVAPTTIQANRAEGFEARKRFAAWIDAQRERWAREAVECVAALDIRFYYGEPMPEAK